MYETMQFQELQGAAEGARPISLSLIDLGSMPGWWKGGGRGLRLLGARWTGVECASRRHQGEDRPFR